MSVKGRARRVDGFQGDDEGRRTTGMCAQNFAYGFGVHADAIDSRDEVTAVALEEDAVFCPMVVFVIFVPDAFEKGVIL